ncbi:hypothetical protein [Sphingobacterium multivorum]|uniref:Uncharacterized protein n=1 Tax=Sphingobacterium multivorum TaxID=28454 RepID=A0A654D558_SPHMU|nr:hypothetical protein [Sphingobacterium multivorum]VXC99663.1 hypothetical protein SPHINGO8BC_51485 [Sphingobacterium multivorum]
MNTEVDKIKKQISSMPLLCLLDLKEKLNQYPFLSYLVLERLKEMDEKSGEYLKEIHSPGHEVQEVHKQDHVQAQPQENCLSRSSRLD